MNGPLYPESQKYRRGCLKIRFLQSHFWRKFHSNSNEWNLTFESQYLDLCKAIISVNFRAYAVYEMCAITCISFVSLGYLKGNWRECFGTFFRSNVHVYLGVVYRRQAGFSSKVKSTLHCLWLWSENCKVSCVWDFR